MATILIANSYFYRLDAKQWKDGRPYPPLGTMLAAAVLRDAGHAVHVFDACLRASAEELQPLLERVKPSILVIYDDGFNYLTKMCLTVMREAAFRMIELGKTAGCQVAINSSDASDHSAAYLNAGADTVVLGEGEATLAELVGKWEERSEWTDIPGIVHDKAGSITTNPKRPVVRDLDRLPLPAWDLVDIAPYKKIWQRSPKGFFSLNIATNEAARSSGNGAQKPSMVTATTHATEHVVNELQLLYAPMSRITSGSLMIFLG